jgi:hypothetical protein
MKSNINQMDAPKLPINPGSTTLYFIIATLVALAVGYVSYMIIIKNKTLSSGARPKINSLEGFQGPANGVSNVKCGQESSYVASLSALFSSKISVTEEGKADLNEFNEILSKLCCLKHDLMSTNQVVQSTLNLKFNTSHDRENPANTTGRCFTKSLPPRDLDIIFETWRDRGLVLLDRLCTSYSLNDNEAKAAKNDLLSVWADVYDIARSVCGPEKIESKSGSPRDVRGVMPERVQTLGPYTGYY